MSQGLSKAEAAAPVKASFKKLRREGMTSVSVERAVH